MKITKQHLVKVIKEELAQTLNEFNEFDDMDRHEAEAKYYSAAPEDEKYDQAWMDNYNDHWDGKGGCGGDGREFRTSYRENYLRKESKSPMPIEGLTDEEWGYWKESFKQAVEDGADTDEASEHANVKIAELRKTHGEERIPIGNDDGIDF